MVDRQLLGKQIRQQYETIIKVMNKTYISQKQQPKIQGLACEK